MPTSRRSRYIAKVPINLHSLYAVSLALKIMIFIKTWAHVGMRPYGGDGTFTEELP